MKRKAIILLMASMILTFGSVGTVFAAEPTTQSEKSTVHEHVWGEPYYVVDKEAEYELVTIVDSPEHKVYGAQLYTEQPDGTWLGNGEIYWFENGFTMDDLQEIIIDKIKNEGYIGNYVNVEKTVPAVTHEEYQEVSPEEGHNEHKCTLCGEIQNSDTGEVIKPGTITQDPTEPDTPANPTDTDNTGNTAQDNDKETQTTGTSEQNSTADENQVPQTGDTMSLISIAALAGSAVTGGTAIRLRRKNKK